ncbi:sugar ABC transporter ATP-binding protein [Paenibacillus zeisoli]|uniref:Sugar ABC transporter ATP-binding protein n=1 Tax=Paenibacillus zeisoli TaxID=2496267 RepID=A0A433X6H6_9BACL|nr:sugar ABC transporter ATP-binding protein [Paenibacillus zeisoli]RUT29649.1 sugar ABC transporter ATP-binding protein [Paenibacillus zeisoli]
MDNVILELAGISKQFGNNYALKDINVKIHEGEFHAIVGENGAGKSTLIKILSGVHLPSEGTVHFKGQTVQFLSPYMAQSSGVSTLFQEIQEIPALSVAENIYLGREPRKGTLLQWKALYQEAKELLNNLDIKIDPYKKMEDLSISERKMVEIARAVSFKAELLIMDEPSANLNEDELQVLFKTIAELRKRNVTIIYISHRLREIFAMADRVTVLRDGQHVKTLDIGDTDETRLVQLMIGRELKEYYPVNTETIGDEVLRVQDLHLPGVLHDVNLSLKKREILGIAGLAGSGGNIISKVLFGLVKHYSGQITLDGKPFSPKNPRQCISRGIAFVPEDRKSQGLFLNLSVRANMSITSLKKFRKNGLVNRSKEVKQANELVEQLSVRPKNIRTPIRSLSGGNQQKALIGRWLLDKYKILILEEPTRGVDVGAKMEIYQEINKLLNKDLSLIIVSSELPELLGMCDRILVFSGGTITGELDRSEATEEKIMEYALQEVK